MRRPFLVLLLLLGTVGGYASGIAHWTGCWHKMDGMRAMRERHIAEVCLEAARHANVPPGAGAPVMAPGAGAPVMGPGAPAWAPPAPPPEDE